MRCIAHFNNPFLLVISHFNSLVFKIIKPDSIRQNLASEEGDEKLCGV